LAIILPSPRAWISYFARSSLLSIRDQVITYGYVTISDLEISYHFGTRHDGCNNVNIKVVNDDFWIRRLM
ncbi:hypothetical protein PILCRDRAFT_56666, partial [Piloderma croceum F 1598]